MKTLIVLIAAAVVAAGGYVGYSYYRVHATRRKAESALENIHLTRGTTPLTAKLVRARVSDRMKKVGLQVSAERVEIVLEPLNRKNISELPGPVREAVRIAGRMKGHGPRFHYLRVRFPVKIEHGLVANKVLLERTYLVKGPVALGGANKGGSVAGDAFDEE